MVISNTTVLLYLLKIQRLDLLERLFSQVIITSMVVTELLVNKEYEQEKVRLQRAIERGFIKVITQKKLIFSGLGHGENSALSLCLEQQERFFLSDDKKARQMARMYTIVPVGLLGIIIKNVERKHILAQEGKAIVDLLITKGFYLSTELYQGVLQELEKR